MYVIDFNVMTITHILISYKCHNLPSKNNFNLDFHINIGFSSYNPENYTHRTHVFKQNNKGLKNLFYHIYFYKTQILLYITSLSAPKTPSNFKKWPRKLIIHVNALIILYNVLY